MVLISVTHYTKIIVFRAYSFQVCTDFTHTSVSHRTQRFHCHGVTSDTFARDYQDKVFISTLHFMVAINLYVHIVLYIYIYICLYIYLYIHTTYTGTNIYSVYVFLYTMLSLIHI